MVRKGECIQLTCSSICSSTCSSTCSFLIFQISLFSLIPLLLCHPFPLDCSHSFRTISERVLDRQMTHQPAARATTIELAQ